MKLIKSVYTMPMHSCGDGNEEPELTVEIVDAGGGDYLVIHAKHWSIEDADDIQRFADKLKSVLAESLAEKRDSD